MQLLPLLQQLLALITPELLMLVGPVVVGLVVKLLRSIWKEKSAAREQLLMMGIEIAYACVSEIAKRTQTKVDDKVAKALEYLRDWMRAGGQELKPVDEVKARQLFQAMHAKELQAMGR